VVFKFPFSSNSASTLSRSLECLSLRGLNLTNDITSEINVVVDWALEGAINDPVDPRGVFIGESGSPMLSAN
jgi:hypothetical protein